VAIRREGLLSAAAFAGAAWGSVVILTSRWCTGTPCAVPTGCNGVRDNGRPSNWRIGGFCERPRIGAAHRWFPSAGAAPERARRPFLPTSLIPRRHHTAGDAPRACLKGRNVGESRQSSWPPGGEHALGACAGPGGGLACIRIAAGLGGHRSCSAPAGEPSAGQNVSLPIGGCCWTVRRVALRLVFGSNDAPCEDC